MSERLRVQHGRPEARGGREHPCAAGSIVGLHRHPIATCRATPRGAPSKQREKDGRLDAPTAIRRGATAPKRLAMATTPPRVAVTFRSGAQKLMRAPVAGRSLALPVLTTRLPARLRSGITRRSTPTYRCGGSRGIRERLPDHRVPVS